MTKRTRWQTLTTRISTQNFGSWYTHTSFDEGGVCHVAFSTPGKFDSTSMAQALDALASAVNASVKEVAALTASVKEAPQ